MNNLQIFSEIIEDIEQSLEGQADICALAQKSQLSIYEFRRIFSFLTGVPINEYIRKRRMTVAAQALLTGCSVTDAAIRYGYDSPSSFTRAFKDFHGITPSELTRERASLRMFTKFQFELGITGGEDVAYTVRQDTAFTICGICGQSGPEDTECCEQVWAQYTADDENEVYAAYLDGDNAVTCHIGIRQPAPQPEGACLEIPAATWLCFRLRGTEDRQVNAFYENILLKYIHSGRMQRNVCLPNLEVFPADMSTEDFEWEIRIPIQQNGVTV